MMWMSFIHTQLAHSKTIGVQQNSHLVNPVFYLFANSNGLKYLQKYSESLKIIKVGCTKEFQLVTCLITVHSSEYYLEQPKFLLSRS